MLKCPKCNAEQEDGALFCNNCGVQLANKLEEVDKNTSGGISNRFDWLKEFGNITAKKAMTILFYLGIVPLLISSILIGKYVYLTNKYLKGISYMQNGTRWYTETEVNNLPLGIFLGVIYFVAGILMWKIVCELLIIIFRCFETYVEKNKR